MPAFGITKLNQLICSDSFSFNNGHFGALSYIMDNTFLFLISFAMGFFVYALLLNHGSSH